MVAGASVLCQLYVIRESCQILALYCITYVLVLVGAKLIIARGSGLALTLAVLAKDGGSPYGQV